MLLFRVCYRPEPFPSSPCSLGPLQEPDSDDMDDAEWAKAVTMGRLSKGDKLGPVDHSKIDYIPFR